MVRNAAECGVPFFKKHPIYFIALNNLKNAGMGTSIIKFSIIFILLVFFSLLKINAQGNLEIMPMRVVFEGPKKIVALNLANTGKDTARYVISTLEIRMNEDGTFERIEQPDSGQNFASSYIRFFPRSITLAPHEAQVIKIQLIKTNLLAPGEYRSHIYFRAVPVELPLGENEPPKDSTTISVRLKAVFGITIPVIIRVGESTAGTNISDMSFQMVNGTVPTLNMVFNRTGNMSVYGDLKIDFISEQGKVTQVGIVKGIAIYTPTSSRQFQVNLSAASDINYHSGKLHVVYSTQPDSKSLKLAEGELVLK